MSTIWDDYPCDANRARGRATRRWAREQITKRQNRPESDGDKETVAESDKIAPGGTSASARANSSDGEDVIRLVLPAIQSDEGRGGAVSQNARLHRLLKGKL